MDRNAAHAAAAQVRGWYVDVPGNRVIVLAAPGATTRARAFAQASGAGTVTVRTMPEQPRMWDCNGSGARLETWTCTGGANQKWHRG